MNEFKLQIFIFLGVFLALYVLLSITLTSLKTSIKIKDKNNKRMMGLLFLFGLNLGFSYCFTLLTNIFEGYDILPRYSMMYLLSLIFGLIAFCFLYIMLFKPEWWTIGSIKRRSVLKMKKE